MQNSIYYAIIIKKKNDVEKLQQKIDWKLTSNTSVLIDLKDVYCNYAKDKYIEFIESDITNTIDLEKLRYKRISSEYTMEIDFINSICSFAFPTKESCDFDITTEFIKNDNEIKLKYKIDDDEKIITIIMKEEQDERINN